MIKVLIIEDDPMVAEINRRYLEPIAGFKCIGVASNAAEALGILQMKSVDLALLDIYMSGQDGLQLLSEIRTKSQSVDVIIISAASDIQSIKLAFRLGAVDYLIKPFAFERFKSALHSYQKEHDILFQHGHLNQNELDKIIFQPNSSFAAHELPKGLTHSTLRRTVEQIKCIGEEPFTTEELSAQIGVSRVSIRKYLNFLEELGFLHASLDYRSVGRPISKYRLNAVNLEVVNTFLKILKS